MSTKANNSKSEAVRVVMTPLGSAASNVFNMLNMSFFLVFSTEALGLNITAMGIIMTVMRIFDGITDPIIGSIIDRTETRFGKFRPFLVIGSLIMLFASFMIYLFSFDIPQSYRMVWVILWYAIWVIGYTFMTTVNKCVLSIVTKNPKYRPLSGIAGGCYSTMLGLIMTTLIVPILQKNGGLGSQKGWTLIIISAFVLHAVLLLGCLFAISATDKPEFYRQDPDKKEEKISIKDSLNVLRLNQPLRMLILAASTDKIASTIQTAVMTYFYIYAVGNLDLQPIVGGISTPMSLIGAFVAGSVAVKFGCKRASLIGAIANFTLEAILIIFRPFGKATILVFIILCTERRSYDCGNHRLSQTKNRKIHAWIYWCYIFTCRQSYQCIWIFYCWYPHGTCRIQRSCRTYNGSVYRYNCYVSWCTSSWRSCKHHCFETIPYYR